MQTRDNEHLKELIDMERILEGVDRKLQDARIDLHDAIWDLIELDKKTCKSDKRPRLIRRGLEKLFKLC